MDLACEAGVVDNPLPNKLPSMTMLALQLIGWFLLATLEQRRNTHAPKEQSLLWTAVMSILCLHPGAPTSGRNAHNVAQKLEYHYINTVWAIHVPKDGFTDELRRTG